MNAKLISLISDKHQTRFSSTDTLRQNLCRQDASTGVHSACRREENGHNLDIWGRCWDFLVLKCGGGLNLQIWDLNRAYETERTVFPILQVFSMCRCKL